MADLSTYDKRTLPEWERALQDPKSEVRKRAVEVISICGSNAIPSLRRALQDSDYDVSAAAAKALNSMLPDKEHVVPPMLEQFLKSPMEDARFNAAMELVNYGPTGSAAVPTLIQALESSSHGTRKLVIDALISIREASVPELMKAFQNTNNDNTRLLIAEILGKIGPWAEKAVPTLAPAIRDNNPAIRSQVAESLILIGPASVSPLVKTLRETGNEDVRNLVTETLGELGQWAVPELTNALNDSHAPTMQRQAASAFSLMALKNKLDSSERAAVRALKKATRNADPVVQLHSAVTLAAISQDPEWVSALMTALSNDSPVLRLRAVTVLGRIGPNAKKAIPMVSKLSVNDPDEEVRGEAALALENITRQPQEVITEEESVDPASR